MTSVQTPRDDAFSAFIEGIKLRALRVAALSGFRADSKSVEPGERLTPGISLRATLGRGKDRIEVTCIGEYSVPEGQMSAAIEVIFDHPDPGAMTKEQEVPFIDQVAMMVAYPMLRTTLIDLAARLDFDAPLLPLHRIGYLSVVKEPEVGRAED